MHGWGEPRLRGRRRVRLLVARLPRWHAWLLVVWLLVVVVVALQLFLHPLGSLGIAAAAGVGCCVGLVAHCLEIALRAIVAFGPAVGPTILPRFEAGVVVAGVVVVVVIVVVVVVVGPAAAVVVVVVPAAAVVVVAPAGVVVVVAVVVAIVVAVVVALVVVVVVPVVVVRKHALLLELVN